ncbi:hypothetical protein F4777DRAFT_582752 [Nemania sp. FL0916]|nr:hypothetical protein F4777DRAFT_582752 [Nemania sp. FL0916]
MRFTSSLAALAAMPMMAMAQYTWTGKITGKTSTTLTFTVATPSDWYSGAPDFSSTCTVTTNKEFGAGCGGDVTALYRTAPTPTALVVDLEYTDASGTTWLASGGSDVDAASVTVGTTLVFSASAPVQDIFG